MGAAYSHTNRPDGTILTDAIYNADHQNHIDNAVPVLLDDYSVNVAQMRSTVDPGEFGSESLAPSLAGELERLRFTIKELKDNINGSAVSQWYSTLSTDFSKSFGADGYTKLANGLILQWGYVLTATTTTSTPGSTQTMNFNFPIAFPTAALAIFGVPNVTDLGSSGNEDIEHTFALGIVDTSGGRARILRLFGAGGGESFGFNYFVIGN